jgi:Ca2+/Na+ antiporter
VILSLAVGAMADAGGDSALNFWGSPFPDIDGEAGHHKLNDSQLLFLTVLYAVILYQSSNLIADGSELLLLIPSLAGLVGSIVLPILGAVPDGMMTLASGMGDDAQSTVGAGVGVLAGSTVMLLTFPWFLAIVSGRVPLDSDGQPCYDKKANVLENGEPKFTGTGLFDSGIAGGDSIPKNAKIMLGTTLIYMIIQIPALGYDPQPDKEDTTDCKTECQADHERIMALVGLVVSVAAFFAYLVVCYCDSKKDDGNALDAIIEGIKNRKVSLGAALEFASKNVSSSSGKLDQESKDTQSLLQKVLKPFFVKYDEDASGTLEFNEFQFLLDDLGEKLIEKEKKKMFRDACMMQDKQPRLDRLGTAQLTTMNTKDLKASLGKLQFAAFCQCMYSYVSDPDRVAHAHKEVEEGPGTADKGKDDDDEEEEEEEIPEDLADLPPDQQRSAILRRSLWMMGLGTFIVVFVSDPFVDCLTAWGDRLGIPTFYISFVVAPFASNASELLSAYAYAAKKTKSSIGTSLSTLIGAACMNNTFCLAIFFALIYWKKLAWQFTAETASIMAIQWLIGIIAIVKNVQTFATGFVILACYPLCLAIVYVMENHMGFD